MNFVVLHLHPRKTRSSSRLQAPAQADDIMTRVGPVYAKMVPKSMPTKFLTLALIMIRSRGLPSLASKFIYIYMYIYIYIERERERDIDVCY